MTGVERIQIQQFDVTSIASPPALLGHQLLLTGLGQSQDCQALLLQNPAMLLRALDAQHRIRGANQPATLDKRVETADPAWLHSLLTDMSLQLVLHGEKHNHLFLQLHWQRSRLAALLAMEIAELTGSKDVYSAGLSGALLYSGMYVLEQQHKSAWVGLFTETPTQARLCEAETQTLGINHVEAGVKLLEGWSLEQTTIDALRYQTRPLHEVLDATPLVKICWLANLLASLSLQVDGQAADAAARFYNWSTDKLQQLLSRVQEKFRQDRQQWGASEHTPGTMGVTPEIELLFEQEVREQLDILQNQILGESALAALEGVGGDSVDALKSVISKALQQSGVDPAFIILTSQGDKDLLQLKTGNRVAGLPGDITIQLAPGRNALSRHVSATELTILGRDSDELAVIDRQLIDLLGGQGLLCEAVENTQARAVLLLAASHAYPGLKLLRGFIRRKLEVFLLQKSQEVPLDLLLYRQRVREAVHEANNPLAIIKNYLQILSIKLGESGATKEIKLINAEIDRVAGILADLRQNQDRVLESGETDLNMVLRNMHKVFAEAFSKDKNITIDLDLTRGSAKVWGRADALKQIVTNLVKNAAEAAVNSGTILISTRQNLYLQEKLYVQLNIADNGPGLDAAVMKKLFVAGTTTKGGSHTGSGLSIVKRLVDEMQGQISCQSDSQGTTFTILLPQIQK